MLNAAAAAATYAAQRKPMQRPGRPNPAGGMSRGFPASGPQQGGGIDGAIQDQMQRFLTGGMAQPRGMAVPPGRLQKMNAPPAWQQLQAMGMGGQGSAAANKAMLGRVNGLLGVPQGPAGAPNQPPGMAPGQGNPMDQAMQAAGAAYQGGQGNPTQQMAMQAAGAGPGMQPQARPFPMQQMMDQPSGGGGGPEPYAQAMTSPGGGAAPAVHQQLLQRVFRGGMGGGGMNGGML